MPRVLAQTIAVVSLVVTPLALGHPILSDTPVNRPWYAPDPSDEIVFIGQVGKDPTELSIRKSAFTTRPLEFELTTDAKKLVIRSSLEPEHQLTIDIDPDAPNRLTLNGDRLHPRIQWQAQELAPLRGQWIRLLLREDPQLILSLPQATYVNIRVFSPRPRQNALSSIVTPATGAALTPPAETVPKIATPLAPASSAGVFPPTPSISPVSAAPSTGAGRTAPPSDTAAIGYPTGVRQRQTTPMLIPPQPVASSKEPALFGDMSFHNGWKLSLDAGAETASAIFYRGLGQENQNAIMQLHTDVAVTIYQNDDAPILNQWDIVAGLRTSHFYGPSGAQRPTSSTKFAELNWYGGMRWRLFKRWTLAAWPRQRTTVSGPTPPLPRDVHSADVLLAFDDSTPSYDWSLQPYALVSFEYEGQSDAGPSPNNDTSVYLELGIRPQFELFKIGQGVPVTLTVPTRVGLSLNNYYQDPITGDDDTFGFFELGLDFGLPLAAISAGDRDLIWRLTVGVHFLVLGDNAQAISSKFGTGGDSFRAVGILGVSVEY